MSNHCHIHSITCFLLIFYAEATFSVPTYASAAEADSLFMVCVTLATADGVSLDLDTVVELMTTEVTGEVEQELFPGA